MEKKSTIKTIKVRNSTSVANIILNKKYQFLCQIVQSNQNQTFNWKNRSRQVSTKSTTTLL